MTASVADAVPIKALARICLILLEVGVAIEWTDDLCVGVDKVDDQHKEIFSRYRAFIDACKAGKGKDEVVRLIEFLGFYVETHFAAEERLMDQVEYPELAAHAEEHAYFKALVERYKQQIAADGASISLIAELNRALLNWLIDHIKKSDMEMGGYVTDRWGLL